MSDAQPSPETDVRAGTPTPYSTPAETGVASPTGSADDVSPDSQDGTLISFGMPVEDRQAKRYTIQVFLLAVAIASFCIVHFIANLLMGTYDSVTVDFRTSTGMNLGQEEGVVYYSVDTLWTSLAGLIIELSIPAAGLLGALYHNRQLTCCFCSCNLFLVFASIWSLLRVALRQNETGGNCQLELDDQQRSLCWMWLDNGAHKWVFIVDLVCSAVLSFSAVLAGFLLFQKLSREPSNIETHPVVGEVVNLRANTPLTRVSRSGTTTPSGQAVSLYAVDRTSTRSNRGDDVEATVPRPSQQSMERPSVRIQLAPAVHEDEY